MFDHKSFILDDVKHAELLLLLLLQFNTPKEAAHKHIQR